MNPNKLALACLAMSASVVFAQQSGSYSNKIVQIQQNDTGETVLYTVDNVSQSGEMDAPLPILYGNAAFELWSFNTVTGDSKLLNSTVVNGFYNPGFVVNTPDPNDTPLQPRTRVDVPYTVKITGISPGYESAAANTLGLIVNLDDFTGETFAFPSDHTPAYSSGTRIDSVLGSMIGNDLEVASNYVTHDQRTLIHGNPKKQLARQDCAAAPVRERPRRIGMIS